MNNSSNTNSNSSLSREDIGGSRSTWMTADPTEYELLKENAKSNRKNMTEAESVFWSLVKGSALGQRCLRQHIIGGYKVIRFTNERILCDTDNVISELRKYL